MRRLGRQVALRRGDGGVEGTRLQPRMEVSVEPGVRLGHSSTKRQAQAYPAVICLPGEYTCAGASLTLSAGDALILPELPISGTVTRGGTLVPPARPCYNDDNGSDCTWGNSWSSPNTRRAELLRARTTRLKHAEHRPGRRGPVRPLIDGVLDIPNSGPERMTRWNARM